MSLFDYERSKHVHLATIDEPFYALLITVMRRADSDNLARLECAFPETAAELRARYNAPGGLLPGEKETAR